MTSNRIASVLDAIDELVADEERPAVRFEPSPLTDEDIDAFINESLRRAQREGNYSPDSVTTDTLRSRLDAVDRQDRTAAQRVTTPEPVPTRRPARRSTRRMPATRTTPYPNRFAGQCVECGERVEPGDGLLSKRGRSWLVTHNECPSSQPVSRPAPAKRAAPRRTTTAEPVRSYTVTFEVEVDGARSPQEAALLAVRLGLTGEVVAQVALADDDDDDTVTEVELTLQ